MNPQSIEGSLKCFYQFKQHQYEYFYSGAKRNYQLRYEDGSSGPPQRQFQRSLSNENWRDRGGDEEEEDGDWRKAGGSKWSMYCMNCSLNHLKLICLLFVAKTSTVITFTYLAWFTFRHHIVQHCAQHLCRTTLHSQLTMWLKPNSTKGKLSLDSHLKGQVLQSHNPKKMWGGEGE